MERGVQSATGLQRAAIDHPSTIYDQSVEDSGGEESFNGRFQSLDYADLDSRQKGPP